MKREDIKKTAEIMRAISNILVILEPFKPEERASVLGGALQASGVDTFLCERDPEMEKAFMELIREQRARRAATKG